MTFFGLVLELELWFMEPKENNVHFGEEILFLFMISILPAFVNLEPLDSVRMSELMELIYIYGEVAVGQLLCNPLGTLILYQATVNIASADPIVEQCVFYCGSDKQVYHAIFVDGHHRRKMQLYRLITPLTTAATKSELVEWTPHSLPWTQAVGICSSQNLLVFDSNDNRIYTPFASSWVISALHDIMDSDPDPDPDPDQLEEDVNPCKLCRLTN